MNILRLKYFVDTAGCENISKAASENFISQTAMSQQISNIEKELEVKLFYRDKGRISLTPAGQSFYEDAVNILELYEQAVTRCRREHSMQTQRSTIVIGILTSSCHDYLEAVINRFGKCYPDVRVRLVQCSFSGMRRDIENGTLDMCICPTFNVENLKNVSIKTVFRENMGFLVPLSDPLAKKSSVYVREIKDKPIIMTSPEFAGVSYERMLEQREIDGHKPKIVELVSSAEIHRMMVAIGRGCAFLPERIGIYDHSKCRMLHINDSVDSNDYAVAWRKQPDKILSCFYKMLVSFFSEEFDDWADNYRRGGGV
jgi:DNA-binding transcriptional LysR family regulator